MKSLVRPLLFAFARLGLFFALLGWVVGQWWEVQANVPHANALLCRHGWCFAIHNQPRRGSISAVATEHLSDLTIERRDWVFGETGPGDRLSSSMQDIANDSMSHRFRGFTYTYYHWLDERCLAIRHWFAALVWLGLNILLRFMDRKRPGRETCEV